MGKLHIYFHKDFDGIASAALLSNILEKLGRYSRFQYFPVDFDIRDAWLDRSIEKTAAVLDFFYHPEASFFFDHHTTSFLNPSHQLNFVETNEMLLDTSFKSTPSILKHKFNNIFDFSPYKELLRWSDIIDNADYESPRDLYENHNQYILLNKIITYHYKDDKKLVEIIRYIINDQINTYLKNNSKLIDEIIAQEKNVVELSKRRLYNISL